MIKQTISMIVACLLTITILCQNTASASSTRDKETRLAEKVKEGIMKLGTGQESRVTVKLKDKTKLSGYVSEITESTFVVTDLKSAEATTVAYPSVVQVKGNNLSTGVKVAIGVGIIVGVIIVLYIVRGAFCDGC